MNALTKNILKKALFALIAVQASAFAVNPAHAQQTIKNVANAEWTVNGSTQKTPSNEVVLTTKPLPVPAAGIEIFRFGRGSGSISAPVAPTKCEANSGTVMVTPQGAFAGVATNPASLLPEDSFTAGEPVIFGLTSLAHNSDPNAIDTVDVTVTMANGDKEDITLTESAANSSRFFGMLNSARIPPALQQNDCKLSVAPGASVRLTVVTKDSLSLSATATIDFLVDANGTSFDSGDGVAVTGTQITLIDVRTGAPAIVYGSDGVSRFPSTIVTGQNVTDAAGTVYTFAPGDYRFPFVAPGEYRLVFGPPSPYTAPSQSTAADLAGLIDAHGVPYQIVEGSYGATFTLTDTAPVRIDIPLDRPGTPLVITKTTSSVSAAPGDAVQYRITVTNSDAARSTGRITVKDTLPASMRLRTNTVRWNGTLVTAEVASNGRDFNVVLPPLAGGKSGVLTYLAEVRPDATPGDAINHARAQDNRGSSSNEVDASIRIVRDEISDRMTIIGRITEGGCSVDPEKSRGIAGVRVMLQDGSYTVTDDEGRYHFEGVKPGLHVVQIEETTLPLDRKAIDCAQNTRSAESAISRFVEGRGGDLKRADFRAVAAEPRASKAVAVKQRDAVLSDRDAAASGRNWTEGQTAGVEWLFPAVDHNPRSKAVRVAIKHLPGQRVELSANGKAVNKATFDGTVKSTDGSVAVSLWRAIEIGDNDTMLSARILDANGALVQELQRNVHYSVAAMQAQLIREKSTLVADGVTRPVIAVRMTDRTGRPIKHSMTGDFSVPSPYYPAVEVDTQQSRQLAGMEKARAVWQVEGENGIAYIELEPTTASGSLPITFTFKDGETTRTQTIDTWLDPGNRPWTIVGFAAGTVGYNTLDDRMEEISGKVDDVNTDARIALYAKGRVQGKWLMTLAYDSDKDVDNTRLHGVIDPTAYYTIYADKSQTRYDAASVRKLYLKLERPQFYALFGDFDTNMGETQLAAYQRTLNGAKAEYRSAQVAASAFAADTPYRSRRDELQGAGISGPYQLGARMILANSERITIEVRDRLHSERIIQETVMVRNMDYDMDYNNGTIRFRTPILSRDSDLNPQFIVATYEVEGVGERVLNAGGRATWQTADEKLRVGATAIHDETDVSKTNLGAVDVRYRPTLETEVRAEFAVSDSKGRNGTTGNNTANAWLIEAEHHDEQFDILAYIRQRESGYGVGQLNRSEDATRKVGFEGRARLTKDLSLTGSAWQEDYLDTDMLRRAGRLLAEYRTGNTTGRVGLTYAHDKRADGEVNESLLAQIGATQRLFNNKLELDVNSEFAIGGKDESADFPSRHRFGARYAVAKEASLVASYEIADGDSIKSRTFRAGLDLTPWAGGRFTATGNQQNIDEYGPRTYAAFGLAQSVQLTKKLSADFTVDANKTLSGADLSSVMNEDHPLASGGHLGDNGLLVEDFVAVTAGATYRSENWSTTGRLEYRNGELVNRYAANFGALRRIGEGRNFGALFTFARAESKDDGPSTQAINLQMSWANRPIDSRWAWLNKLELREDKVWNAVAGEPGPIGGPDLLVSGDQRSRRVINSLSVNFVPLNERDVKGGNGAREFIERGEYSFFWGARYVSDKIGVDDVDGLSNIFGADARFDITDYLEIGAAGTVRISGDGNAYTWSGGPQIGATPFKNGYVTLGYNFMGYRDADFEDARYTRSGPYITFRLKFDQNTFQGLGLLSKP